MAKVHKLNTTNRTASIESVDKAFNLLKNKVLKSYKPKSSEEIKDKTIRSQCLSNVTSMHKRSTACLAFSHTQALAEMRNALIHEDWSTMQEIFPLLFKCVNSHNLIWRYAFLIHLLCPYTDLSCFQEFFTMTIGKDYVNNEFYLEKLMTLHAEIKPDNQ